MKGSHGSSGIPFSPPEVDVAALVHLATHEVRSPIRAIGSLCHWLEEDLEAALTDESREHLDLLKAQADRLDRLVMDLSAYARAGLEPAPFEPVDVGALLQQVILVLDAPPDFDLRLGPGMPTLVTDRRALSQVFTALIDNAIRHHDQPDGRVEIDAADSGDLYTFTVRDDGPGLPEGLHDRAFEPFRKLHSRGEGPSSGMGLAIARRLTEAVGGRIALEPAAPRGCCIRFTWPMQPTEPPATDD